MHAEIVNFLELSGALGWAAIGVWALCRTVSRGHQIARELHEFFLVNDRETEPVLTGVPVRVVDRELRDVRVMPSVKPTPLHTVNGGMPRSHTPSSPDGRDRKRPVPTADLQQKARLTLVKSDQPGTATNRERGGHGFSAGA